MDTAFRQFVLDRLGHTTSGPVTVLGFNAKITGLSAVRTLANGFKADGTTAAAVPAGATIVRIVSESQDIRWTDDGQDPTASFGEVLPAGFELTYAGDLTALKFLEQAASAVLQVKYYKPS